MLLFLARLIATLPSIFRSRAALTLENLALRHYTTYAELDGLSLLTVLLRHICQTKTISNPEEKQNLDATELGKRHGRLPLG